MNPLGMVTLVRNHFLVYKTLKNSELKVLPVYTGEDPFSVSQLAKPFLNSVIQLFFLECRCHTPTTIICLSPFDPL
jgi:hypothetical protein